MTVVVSWSAADRGYTVHAAAVSPHRVAALVEMHRTPEGARFFRDVGRYDAFECVGDVCRAAHPGGMVVLSETDSRHDAVTIQFRGTSSHADIDGVWTFSPAEPPGAAGTHVQLTQIVRPRGIARILGLRAVVERRVRRLLEDHGCTL